MVYCSGSVCEAEASGPPALVRGRRPWRESGRWLPGHCHRGSASAALAPPLWAERHQRSRARTDWRLPENTVQRYLHFLVFRFYSLSIEHFALCWSYAPLLCFRFPAGALSCGARTTTVPWETWHSHGQNPARLWRVSQDHDGEFPRRVYARSWLWLLCKVI